MKQCSKCGAEMPDFAKFCGECGKPFEKEQIMNNVPPQTLNRQPMWQQQSQQQPTTVIIQSQTNGLGTAGFVVSLIGLFTFYIPIFGFIIWFIGSSLSYYGRKKEPKGLAIAGTIISLITCVLWLLCWYLFKSIMNSLLDIF